MERITMRKRVLLCRCHIIMSNCLVLLTFSLLLGVISCLCKHITKGNVVTSVVDDIVSAIAEEAGHASSVTWQWNVWLQCLL